MKIDINRIIPRFVESVLKRGNSKEALLISLSYHYSYCTEEGREFNDYGKFNLVFVRRNNYTLVMASPTKSTFIQPKDKFTITSYHDSCWKYDGFMFLSKAVEKCYENIINKIKKAGLKYKGNPFKDFHEFIAVERIELIGFTDPFLPTDRNKEYNFQNGKFIAVTS